MTGLTSDELGRQRRTAMKTITVQAEVSADQILRVEIPCDLRPSPVEVMLTIPKDEGDGAPGPID
jgi:hypothetical protein